MTFVHVIDSFLQGLLRINHRACSHTTLEKTGGHFTNLITFPYLSLPSIMSLWREKPRKYVEMTLSVYLILQQQREWKLEQLQCKDSIYLRKSQRWLNQVRANNKCRLQGEALCYFYLKMLYNVKIFTVILFTAIKSKYCCCKIVLWSLYRRKILYSAT